MNFLKSYNFEHCNPKKYVMATVAVMKNSSLAAIIGGVTIGGIVGADTIYEKVTGESALTEIGKWTGIHRDSPNRR